MPLLQKFIFLLSFGTQLFIPSPEKNIHTEQQILLVSEGNGRIYPLHLGSNYSSLSSMPNIQINLSFDGSFLKNPFSYTSKQRIQEWDSILLDAIIHRNTGSLRMLCFIICVSQRAGTGCLSWMKYRTSES